MSVVVKSIQFYQRWISPFKPRVCRFYPSCSEYAKQACERYGTWRGTQKAFKRILKCHPLHPGGFDPV